MIRRAAVAGAFYPGTREALRKALESLVVSSDTPETVMGVVSPHAGYQYSGGAAGELFGAIQVPDKVIVLCPNHTGLGVPVSLWPEGEWETPLGRVRIDADLCRLLRDSSAAVEPDTLSHLREHAAEVQIPFLQYRNSSVAVAVVVLASHGGGAAEEDLLTELGRGIGELLKSTGENVLIVASSDMTHYEPAGNAREKDMRAVAFMERMDAVGLFRYVTRERVSMCGYAPATVMLSACRELGAKAGRLVRYTNSGEVTGDDESVVGYAALTIA